MQHQVALVAGPGQHLPDRLELEGQVVAEGAVQAQVVVDALERGDHLADRGEDRGAAAAHLLGEDLAGLGDVHLDVVGRRLPGGLAGGEQAGGDGGQHDPAPGVQRAGGDPAPPATISRQGST
nr:hypothetical protein GCM10020093_015330 [Planobispora longispora]